MKNKLDVEDPIERDERLKRLGFDRKLDKQLKNEKYDLAISLSASVSSSLLLFFARIPNRIGFAESGSQIFWTDSLKWKGRNSGMHKSALYLELLNYL